MSRSWVSLPTVIPYIVPEATQIKFLLKRLRNLSQDGASSIVLSGSTKISPLRKKTADIISKQSAHSPKLAAGGFRLQYGHTSGRENLNEDASSQISASSFGAFRTKASFSAMGRSRAFTSLAHDRTLSVCLISIFMRGRWKKPLLWWRCSPFLGSIIPTDTIRGILKGDYLLELCCARATPMAHSPFASDRTQPASD